MHFLESLILGIIEGITEFLPISSTAHLILASDILKIQQTDFHKFFEVFIQSGAILAVIFTYFKTIKSNKELIKKIAITFLPTAFFGFILYKIIKNVFFESKIIIIFALIVVGVLFIIVEKILKKNNLISSLELDNLSYKTAFLIGVFQSLAVIPGVSRAGAVILGMIILGFKRKDAVLYSFLVAVPTILSAGLFDLYKTGINTISLNTSNIISLIIGFLSSFIFALFSTKWLIKYLQNNKLTSFGIYRITIGLLFLIYFFII
jgi:undecaprenyl-diphosphatase